MGFKSKSDKKPYTRKQALAKAMNYCARQERCHQEMRNKLYDWGLKPAEVENIIVDLIAQDFLNEERFARLYAGGKFRIKEWGRRRIELELKKRKISEHCIRQGVLEIEDEDYLETLDRTINKRWAVAREKDLFKRRDKVGIYCINKGFEPDLVWTRLKKMK